MDKPNLAEEVNQLHAELCSALADATRIMLIYALSEESCNVSELTARLNISQPAASRHLKVLRERGLVRWTRSGANVVYSLTDKRLVDALDMLRAILRDRVAYRASILEND